jgi:hypothetical protein
MTGINASVVVLQDIRTFYRVRREDVTCFTSLLWATGWWSGENECCARICLCVQFSSHGELDGVSSRFCCENLFCNEVDCAEAKMFSAWVWCNVHGSVVNKLLGLHVPFTVQIKLKSDRNKVQYKALSKAAADRLTDVKQVRSRNFARTLEVSSVQNSRNAWTERTG